MVDNIEVDPDTGELWVGCHPIAFRALDWMLNAFGMTLPSQVFVGIIAFMSILPCKLLFCQKHVRWNISISK
jgi:hypothetical protein